MNAKFWIMKEGEKWTDGSGELIIENGCFSIGAATLSEYTIIEAHGSGLSVSGISGCDPQTWRVEFGEVIHKNEKKTPMPITGKKTSLIIRPSIDDAIYSDLKKWAVSQGIEIDEAVAILIGRSFGY